MATTNVKKEKHIPIEFLKENFEICNGNLIWKKSNINIIKIGDLAGSKCVNGYKELNIKYNNKYVRLFVHRVVFAIYNNKWPKGIIDHIDGNRSNNNPKNLRDVDNSQNALNSDKPRKNNSLGIQGIYKHSGGFQAELAFRGKRIRKWFKKLEDAIKFRIEQKNILKSKAYL